MSSLEMPFSISRPTCVVSNNPDEAPYFNERSLIGSLVSMIRRVAPTTAPVLIQGETGTGKEWLARHLHDSSQRAGAAFVAVNCAAVPGPLFESEFFGHARGAFTGAVEARAGLFGAAENGTLFLDEVGDMPLDLQAKMLRALESGRVHRLGEANDRSANVRIVAATNRPLIEQVECGGFRGDLFYRLGVITIDVPPLRERPDDIEPLIRHFIRHFSRQHRLPAPAIQQSVLDAAKAAHWAGNVRELRNYVERAVLLSRWGELAPIGSTDIALRAPSPDDTLETVERKQILRILAVAQGQIAGPRGAARLLGLHPNTLRSKMKKLGLRRQWSPQGNG